ncbi:MAG: shikimate dehydrogenase [Leucobacter sp.]
MTDASRLAVLGSPIEHSRSPEIHAAAYEALGLDWSYGRQRLEAAELEGFLASRGPQWRGFSLTMPLKEEAHRLASVLDPVAEESGVANTLLRIVSGVDGRPRWAGFNTDVAGLAAAIRGAGLDASSTVVLGSGATAVSAILAARSLGARCVTVAARRVEAAEQLAERFDGSLETDTRSSCARNESQDLSERDAATARSMTEERRLLVRAEHLASKFDLAAATLVISTLPGPAGHELGLPEGITGIPLFDVAYDPWPSPLAERWRAGGGEAHAGTAMLVEQALIQIRVFRGGDPAAVLPDEAAVLAAMRAAV